MVLHTLVCSFFTVYCGLMDASPRLLLSHATSCTHASSVAIGTGLFLLSECHLQDPVHVKAIRHQINAIISLFRLNANAEPCYTGASAAATQLLVTNLKILPPSRPSNFASHQDLSYTGYR